MVYLTGAHIATNGIVNPVSQESIQPAGIDLTLDSIVAFDAPGTLSPHERIIPKGIPLEISEDSYYHIGPGAYRIRFREIVSIPEWGVGFCLPRSSLLRMGASLHCAVWDPGYKGRGEALLVVHNPHGIKLTRGTRVAQLVIARLESLPTDKYRGAFWGEGLT
ncbi:MAG: deoxyuridine 5'-triphosphate nucleotidohydrolase [Desulfurococcales archaeon]|nr:deoxyuridine 5'-triphosphate nucleotidohydrolase [Desulfurococcales archaeon]